MIKYLEQNWKSDSTDIGVHDGIESVFIGRKIVKAELLPDRDITSVGGYLTLDDGTLLTVVGNDGGCGCSNGCYEITGLNTFDNVITSVEVVEEDDECGEAGPVRLFVYSEGVDGVEVISSDGTDNGYYGTGFWVRVERP